MSRILVTRPQPGASATASRLRDMGHEPVLLPLTSIERLNIPSLADPAGFDAVLATSVNAIRQASKELLGDLVSKPIFVVGGRTAAQAREAGFGTIESADGEAEALAGIVSGAVTPQARLLYLAGAQRRTALEDRLRADGCRIEVAVTYAAPEVSYSSDFLVKAFNESPLDFALVYSARGGMLLARLASRQEITQLFDKTVFLAISQRAAAALGTSASGRIRIADRPTEDALLTLLPPA